jgi:RHS repeat-associated protein
MYNELNFNQNSCTGEYRYGFGGQEKDDEISGEGNNYTAEFWQYDPRLGRRWNIDPLTFKYPWQSPYSAFNNNPIFFNDPLGLEGEDPKEGGGDDIKVEQDLPEVDIIAKRPEKVIEKQISIIRESLNPEGADKFRRSYMAFTTARDAMRDKQHSYGTSEFSRDYDKFGWINYDLNRSTFNSKEVRNVIMEGKAQSMERFTYFAGALALGGVAYVAAPVLLSSSSAFGISQALSWKTIALKMGFSAASQAIINEGRINVFGVVGDGFLGYGSSAIIGSGIELNVSIAGDQTTFNYLGNGIDGQRFLFNSSIGIVFGAGSSSLNTLMSSGKDGLKSSFLREFILGPRQLGTYGVNRAYEKNR